MIVIRRGPTEFIPPVSTIQITCGDCSSLLEVSAGDAKTTIHINEGKAKGTVHLIDCAVCGHEMIINVARFRKVF